VDPDAHPFSSHWARGDARANSFHTRAFSAHIEIRDGPRRSDSPLRRSRRPCPQQDGITSDILPAYLQALLTVRLIEPDYLCRRAAARLAHHTPPLSPRDLAVALCKMAAQTCAGQDILPKLVPQLLTPFSVTLSNLLARIRRLVPPKI